MLGFLACLGPPAIIAVMGETNRESRWAFLATLLVILLVAGGLRLYRLPELPQGLHYDEAANGILATGIAAAKDRPIFIGAYTGKEVLFFYWAALWIKLLGATPLALRLSSALAGVATVAAAVWMVRELLGDRADSRWIALLSGGFLATSFWHLILSRYGFRAVTQPLMQALTIAALWHGLRLAPDQASLRRQRTRWLVLAGVFCGLTGYTYLAARAFPILLGVGFLALILADREHRRARVRQIGLFILVAALVIAPEVIFWIRHPGSFLNRTQQVAAGNWREVWRGILACLGMFFVTGDPYIRFNLPLRPIFAPTGAVLFVLGVLLSMWKLVARQMPDGKPEDAGDRPLRVAGYVFLLCALPVMVLPSALASGEITPSQMRTVGLLPMVYVFPALALNELKRLLLSQPYLRQGHPHSGRLSWRAALRQPVGLIAGVLLITALQLPGTVQAYFGDWAISPDLYTAADGDLVDAAAYLNGQELPQTVTPYVASIHYRHPTMAFLVEDYERVRFLRGGTTIVLPNEGNALLLYPRSADEELNWVQSVLPDKALISAPPGPDGEAAFHVFMVGPDVRIAPGRPLAADFSQTAELVGYDVLGEPASGGSVEIAVTWRVLQPIQPGDFGVVARLVDAWGFTWGEAQPFDYPGEQWTAGETVIDRLSIPVAPGAPHGKYSVRIGFYSAQADSMLSVLDDAGHHVGKWADLPVSLAPAATSAAAEELQIRSLLDKTSGGLTLLGANLDTHTARPGEPLFLTLFWRADRAHLPEYFVQLQLGETLLYLDSPVHGTYPVSQWTEGEVVADRYNIRLPLDTPPGEHVLALDLVDPFHDADPDLSVELDTITVEATERSFDVPSIAHPLNSTLGDSVELLGYSISTENLTPGDTLVLTLYWRTLSEMAEDYTVFTHIVGPDGSMSGQQDNAPAGGTYPTSLWVAREVVTDRYDIEIREEATTGMQRVEVGMYVAENGIRLPVKDTGHDTIVLEEIEIR
ncbi:MAG: glycosyltransferase family 39 protein [Anaerolineae bacterium]|nr:glycosyltransferase family 39 protein [Anaerolineae bacterium]